MTKTVKPVIGKRKSVKILFFGDIVGRIGRHAIAQALPELRRELEPDVVIANVENIAHGKGVTENTVQEILDSGVDVLTSGNHVFRKNGYEELLNNSEIPIIRPANYPEGTPGRGHIVLDVGNSALCVINLMGRAFFREDLDNPFKALDDILEKIQADTIIVDWHAEASSEKYGMGWHADGRVSAVLGTHTHVPTADARIFPNGTGYVSDVGMVGARDSMLGVDIDGPLGMMKTQLPHVFEVPESGIVQVNSVYLEIDEKSGKTRDIKRVDREINII